MILGIADTRIVIIISNIDIAIGIIEKTHARHNQRERNRLNREQ